MYFNDEKSNTNIDRELSDKSILSNIKKNLVKIIVIVITIILLIGLILVIVGLMKNRVSFKLLGESYIKLPVGSEYVEPGYIATDKNGVDISDEVAETGNVDTTSVGTYKIIYVLRNKRLQRIVKVEELPMANISLIGDKVIKIKLNDTYTEPGYTCLDEVDGDITDNVEVISEVNTSKLGVYKIVYRVTNSSNVTTAVSRVVIVE